MVVVSPVPEAKPQTPSCTTRTASPSVAWSVLDSRLRSRNVRTPSPDPLDPQVGVAAAEGVRAAQRRVGERPQRERREAGVDTA